MNCKFYKVVLISVCACMIAVLTACGESRFEKAYQAAKTLSQNDNLSDTEAIKYLEKSEELLRKFTSVKIRAEKRHLYVLDKLLQHYESLQMWPKANRIVNRLIKFQPTKKEWYFTKGRINSQWAKLSEDRIELARRAFLTALEIDPEFLRAHYALGVLLAFRASEPSEARSHLKRVSKYRPRTAKNLTLVQDARFALGKLEYQQGNFAAAINTFRKIARMNGISDNSKVQAYVNMGDAALKTGNRDQAKRVFRKAYEIQPSNSTVRRALRDLDVELSDRFNKFE